MLLLYNLSDILDSHKLDFSNFGKYPFLAKRGEGGYYWEEQVVSLAQRLDTVGNSYVTKYAHEQL